MPKTNIEQLKEKMRKRFFIIFTDEKDKENDYYDSQFTGLKPTDVADWWLKELDQAVQARNEELVEMIKHISSICRKCNKPGGNPFGECVCSFKDSGLVRREAIISLISPNHVEHSETNKEK